MSLWIQYFWKNDRTNFVVSCMGLLFTPILMLFAPYVTQGGARFVTSVAFPFALFLCSNLSLIIVTSFTRNEILQLKPHALRKTRESLLIINVSLLLFIFIGCAMYQGGHLSLIMLIWALQTVVITLYFLFPSKKFGVLSNLPFVLAIVLFFSSAELPLMHWGWTLVAGVIIVLAYAALLKGPYYANTIAIDRKAQTGNTTNIFEWLRSQPKNPAFQFRIFGIFGLYHSDILLWQLVVTLSLPLELLAILFYSVKFQDVAILNLILISTLLCFMHLSTFKKQGKSMAAWYLMPFSHSREDYTRKLLRDSTLCQIKLLLPHYLLFLLSAIAANTLSLSAFLLLPLISIICALFAWLCVIRQWFESVTGFIIIFVHAAFPVAVSKPYANSYLLIISVVIGLALLICWLYRQVHVALTETDWS